MKTFITNLLATCITLSSGSALLAQQLAPGMWKVKTDFKLNGISLPTTDDEECITAAEAKDAKTTVAKELKRNDCELKNWKVKGKNLEASISCKRSEIEAEGILKGTFNEKSYELFGEAAGTFQGIIPSTATLKLIGTWVKTCKLSTAIK